MLYILSSREKRAGHLVSLTGGLQNQVVCQEFWVIIAFSTVFGHHLFIFNQIPPDFAQHFYFSWTFYANEKVSFLRA